MPLADLSGRGHKKGRNQVSGSISVSRLYSKTIKRDLKSLKRSVQRLSPSSCFQVLSTKIASLASDWFILFSKCWTEFGGLKYTNLISSVHWEIKFNILSRVNLLKAPTQLFTVKSFIFFFYFQMKTTKYTSIYISMFNERIVPLLYYVYLIHPQFKLYCFFVSVFFFGGGGVTLFQFPKTEGAAFHFDFP